MNRPIYTKEEQEFINKWGYESDRDYDLKRFAKSPSTGKRITCLDLAKLNKEAEDEIIAYKKKHGIE
jgi:hypothetical protein